MVSLQVVDQLYYTSFLVIQTRFIIPLYSYQLYDHPIDVRCKEYRQSWAASAATIVAAILAERPVKLIIQ